MTPKRSAPRPDVQAVGNTVWMRVKLVQSGTQTAIRIHSMPDAGGLDKTDGSLHSDAGLKHPESPAPVAERDTGIPLPCRRNVGHFNGETETPDAKIGAEAAGNGYVQISAGTTGAGIFTAFPLAAETDGIEGFRGPKNPASRTGFCPAVHRSGDATHRGKMKKTGTAGPVDRIACGAANGAAGHDPRMKEVYESARKRHADRHALAVVVANKTTTIHAAHAQDNGGYG